MDAEVESVMASSQDQREEELQVKFHPSFCRICISTVGFHSFSHFYFLHLAA